MDRSPYQDKIIKRYYENKPEIMRQKLSELVTELYLAETVKKRESIWKRIVLALRNLKIPEERVNALVERNDPAVLARFIESNLEKF
ncbi:MAG: hypothetical protein IJL92_06415 [Thermoguttaceae bacterium]|nr:hypothetical protein [Thermoguttaceae bacterium]